MPTPRKIKRMSLGDHEALARHYQLRWPQFECTLQHLPDDTDSCELIANHRCPFLVKGDRKRQYAKALTAGLVQEFGSASQVERNRSQVLTLQPSTEFFVELTDYFPGTK